MFELYPRHSHRSPAQIAEDGGGSFEPRRVSREKNASAVERDISDNQAQHGGDSTSADSSSDGRSTR